jgi:hypothetical protein
VLFLELLIYLSCHQAKALIAGVPKAFACLFCAGMMLQDTSLLWLLLEAKTMKSGDVPKPKAWSVSYGCEVSVLACSFYKP